MSISITQTLVKVIGFVLAIVGLFLLLSVVGLSTGIMLAPVWLALLVGFLFLAIGIYIVFDGTFTP